MEIEMQPQCSASTAFSVENHTGDSVMDEPRAHTFEKSSDNSYCMVEEQTMQNIDDVKSTIITDQMKKSLLRFAYNSNKHSNGTEARNGLVRDDFPSHFVKSVLDYDQSCLYSDVDLQSGSAATARLHTGEKPTTSETNAHPVLPVNILVLASWSPLLHRIMTETMTIVTMTAASSSLTADVEVSQQCAVQRPVIILDGFEPQTIHEFMQLIYSGSLTTSHDDGKEIRRLLKVLRVREGEKFHLLDPVDKPRKRRPIFETLDNNPATTPVVSVPILSSAVATQNDDDGGDIAAMGEPFETPSPKQEEVPAMESHVIVSESGIDISALTAAHCFDPNVAMLPPSVPPIHSTGTVAHHRRPLEPPRRRKSHPLNAINNWKIRRTKKLEAEKTGDKLGISFQTPRYRFRKKNMNRTCHICHKNFVTSYGVKKHIRNTHSTDMVQCDMCEKQFKSKHHLHSHKTTTHSKDVVPCDECDKVYKSKKELQKHKLSHLETTRFNCRYCGKGFNQRDRFETHEKVHAGMTFDCSDCKKQFQSKLGLERHCCGDKPKPFICSVCSKGFMAKDRLDQHMNSHTGENLYHCALCPKTFCYEQSFNLHMEIHEGRKKCVCEICGSCFVLQSSLNSHMYTHNPAGRPKPYPCTMCSLSFTSNHNLRKHVMTHTGEKPFRCTICGRSFGTSGCLERHMLRHTTSDQKKYSCSLCSKMFATTRGLNEHSRTHTREKPPSSSQQCNICNEQFSSSALLSTHKQQAHNPQPPASSVVAAETIPPNVPILQQPPAKYEANNHHLQQQPDELQNHHPPPQQQQQQHQQHQHALGACRERDQQQQQQQQQLNMFNQRDLAAAQYAAFGHLRFGL